MGHRHNFIVACQLLFFLVNFQQHGVAYTTKGTALAMYKEMNQ